jgi:hypothetical protein
MHVAAHIRSFRCAEIIDSWLTDGLATDMPVIVPAFCLQIEERPKTLGESEDRQSCPGYSAQVTGRDDVRLDGVVCGVRWVARATAEFDQLRADRDTGYERLATRDEDWRRALEVQGACGAAGRPGQSASPIC